MIASGKSAGRQKRRRLVDRLFKYLCLFSAALGALILIALLAKILGDGLPKLSKQFIFSMPSSRPKSAGIYAGILGTLWVMVITAIIVIPLGVGAALFLEEFTSKKTRLTNTVQVLINNLAGVPSIVYGLLGLAVFVRTLNMGNSVLAGGATMSLLILPMVIIITQEALRGVPKSYREASLALGSTQWQAIRRQVLPSAMPGIMTGIILSLGRAIGETAPLIVVGAVSYVSSIPTKPSDRYTALPIHIFDWAKDPRKEFNQDAASAIVVLIIALLLMNSVAIILRSRAAKRFV